MTIFLRCLSENKNNLPDLLLDLTVAMLIKVKTLTGKEIEIDIEPTDRVERIKERVEEKEVRTVLH